MPALESVQPVRTVGFVTNSSQRERRQKKLAEEEAALKELMAGKKTSEDVEDETTDDESNQEDLGSQTQNKEDEDLSQEDKSLSAEESTFKKRYGDLRRHSQKKEEELTAKIEALEARLNSGSAIVPPKSDEDIAQWAKKYPDIAGIIERIAEKKAEERSGSLAERIKELDEERYNIARDKAEAAIRKAHPNFDTLKEDEAFHTWIGKQSKWVQDAVYENENDPQAVIDVIDLYNTKTGQTPADRKQQVKEAAKSVTTPSKATVDDNEKPKFSESQIQKNTDAWFVKNLEAIKEAQREGRFIYDLSGGAR